MKLNILTLALILTASSFSFADHNHFSSNCQVVQYQDRTEGHWEKQFVPATYRTVRVFDSCSRTYIQKQILVTPACYKNVWIEGCYVTKTRYICTPVVQAPVYRTSTSIHFGERAPSEYYRTNNYRSYSEQDNFRQSTSYPSSFSRNNYENRNRYENRNTYENRNRYENRNDFRGQSSFRFQRQHKNRNFNLNFDF